MSFFASGLIAGIVLWLVPGQHSGPACVVAGLLLNFLLLQLGPRSVVERMGAVLTAALLAWGAGPRSAYGQSLLWHLLGWGAAGAALAYYLAPKSE